MKSKITHGKKGGSPNNYQDNIDIMHNIFLFNRLNNFQSLPLDTINRRKYQVSREFPRNSNFAECPGEYKEAVSKP
jgi:hypothetical protein